MKRTSSQLWLFLFGGTVPLLLLGYYMVTIFPMLPERVAVHWDWQGHPNRWMSREHYYVFLAVFIGGMNLLLSLAQWIPMGFLQFPFKDNRRTDPIIRAKMATRRGLGILIAMILNNWFALVAFHMTVSQAIPHATPFVPISVRQFLMICVFAIVIFLVWFSKFMMLPQEEQKS